MVEVDFTTKDMIALEDNINNYFNGHKPPKMDKDMIKLLRKINIMREAFEEIDAEEAKYAEEDL